MVVARRGDAGDVDGFEEATHGGPKALVGGINKACVSEQRLLLVNGGSSGAEVVGGRFEAILHFRHSLLHEPELLLDLVGGGHRGHEHNTRNRRDYGDQIGTHWVFLLVGCRTLHSNRARSRKSGPRGGCEGIEDDPGAATASSSDEG